MGIVLKVLVAILVGYIIFRIGLAFLRMFAQPVAEPPPPGELRRVKLMYRCDLCGTEVRMTAALDEDPEPPRHCLEDMTLVTPIGDL
jgi:hypothetical protein